MDIEKLRKEMTREEFLKYERENNEQCPSDFGLKDIYCSEKDCIFNFECEKCWEKSVENIKFKDDMEDKKLNKELNILQAIEMPIGTEFRVKNNLSNIKVVDSEDYGINRSISKKILCWSDSGKILNFGNYEVGLTLSPIQQPVSFMEAIKASREGKIIKVDTGIRIYTYYPKDDELCELTAKESNGGLSVYEILEGKWYIHEDNAND